MEVKILLTIFLLIELISLYDEREKYSLQMKKLMFYNAF